MVVIGSRLAIVGHYGCASYPSLRKRPDPNGKGRRKRRPLLIFDLVFY